MANSVKIAVSLPEKLLKETEKLLAESGESRSAFVQRALHRLLQERCAEEAERRYVEGYRHFPESAEEIEAAEASLKALLAEEPWE